jgi:Fimbrial assembly protein (PilN)
MEKLNIDFCAGRRGTPWAGRVLLAAAAFIAADVGVSYQSAREVLAENEARVAQRGTSTVAVAKVTPQEVAAVRDTVERLALPWNELFGALEAAANDRVAVAGIEPDPKKGTVTISGDGKDYLAALSYVFNLSRSESLGHVQLLRHEQKANDPNGAVSFAVSATWSAK